MAATSSCGGGGGGRLTTQTLTDGLTTQTLTDVLGARITPVRGTVFSRPSISGLLSVHWCLSVFFQSRSYLSSYSVM